MESLTPLRQCFLLVIIEGVRKFPPTGSFQPGAKLLKNKKTLFYEETVLPKY